MNGTSDAWRDALRALWLTLRGQYGARAKDLGDEPNAGWVLALGDLSPAQIRHGMERLAVAHPAWPPTAGQFVELAAGGNAQQRADAARRLEVDTAARALPSPEQAAGRTPAGRRWLAFWRLEGLRPRPRGMTLDDLDAELGDADLEAMPASVAASRSAILRRMRVDEAEFDRVSRERHARAAAKLNRSRADLEERLEELAGRHVSDGIDPTLAAGLARRELLEQEA